MHHTVIRKLKDENFLSDFFGKKFLHLRNIIDPAEILNNRSFKNLLHDKELAPSAAIIRTFTSTEFYNGMLRELSEPTFEMEMSRSGTIDDLVELRNKNYGILSLRYESQQLKNLIFELEHYISAFAFSYKNSILELPYSIKTLGISAPIDCFIILLEGRQKFTLDRSVGKLNSTYIELSDGRIFETSVRSSLKDRYFKKENIIGELVEIEVSPGDMLYIPAYTYHFSESLNGSSSLSCSISAEFQSFINIIEDVIRYTDPLKMSELSQCFTLANSSMQNKKLLCEKLEDLLHYFNEKETSYFRYFPLVSSFYSKNSLSNSIPNASNSDIISQNQLIVTKYSIALDTIMRFCFNNIKNESYVYVNEREYVFSGEFWPKIWMEILDQRSFSIKGIMENFSVSKAEIRALIDLVSLCVKNGEFLINRNQDDLISA